MDLNNAESSELQQQIKQFIIQQIVRPDEDLVRLLAAKVYRGRLSAGNVDWFTHVTQQAIQDVFSKTQLIGQPVDSSHEHLLIVEDDHGKREVGLSNPIYSIGRDPSCDICIASPFISFNHATLVQLPKDKGGHYYRIVDGDMKGTPSANGLLINGKKVAQAANLYDGDTILFGPEIHGTYYDLTRSSSRSTSPGLGSSTGSEDLGRRQSLSRSLAQEFLKFAGITS
ncbi:MAG: FHA domain-containing protein [Leptolyngbyaceae cyanobacterium MO_188.B28]|nr:FHA domain-containing protein [Leptolyngbyaceae cyanobacterium MO_188.B28]